MSLPKNFWSKVVVTPGCWLWTGAKTGKGHGKFWVKGKSYLVHRLSWDDYYPNNKVPPEIPLDHKCRVKNCINPTHLQFSTNKLNHQNREANQNSTTCIRGVSFKRRQRKFEVYATVNGKRHSGGVFEDVISAEKAAIALRNKLMTNNLADR